MAEWRLMKEMTENYSKLIEKLKEELKIEKKKAY